MDNWENQDFGDDDEMDEIPAHDESFVLPKEKRRQKKPSSDDVRSSKKSKSRPAAVVCLPCRTSKRKCDGQIPCQRCRDNQKPEMCIQVVPKKRGRKVKTLEEGGKGGAENLIIELAPGFELQDLQLGQQQRVILSMMMAYADKALQDRPRDIAASFGLDFQSGFVAVQYNKGLSDPIQAFYNSYVVSAGISEEPKFPDIVNDPSVYIGRTLGALTVEHDHRAQTTTDQNGQILLARVLSTPAPIPRKPYIRRYRTKREIYSQNNVPTKVVLENTIFMNEEGRPQWMFISIADRESHGQATIDVSKLDSEVFLTSQGFDTTSFSLSDDDSKWDLQDDLWITRDLGSNVLKLDDNIFDLPL